MKPSPRILMAAILAVLALTVVLVSVSRLSSARVPPPPPPGLSCEEAARQAAPAVRAVQASLDSFSRPPPPGEPAIRLRTATLTASLLPPGDPSAPTHSRTSPRGYPWMVLFEGPIRPEWREALAKAGGIPRAYLPENALLFEAPSSAITAIRQSPHVLWTGEYRPDYKVQPLLAAMSRNHPALPLPVTIQTFAPEDVPTLSNLLASAGASDIRATPARRWGLLRAVLPAQAACDLAWLPEVQWIEHHEPPRILNDQARAAHHLNLDAAHDDYGLDGSGQIVAIADTGLDTGDTNTLHPDLAGRLLQVFDTGRLTNWSDTYYHGTHVAGSLLGSGAASDGQYRGAAPGAHLVFQSIMTAYNTLALPADLNEFYLPPHGAGARIHSDSWGSAVNGEYTADSMTTDEFIWDHPDLLVVFAAGNEGTDTDRNGVVDAGSLDAPASAKNVLSVGASENGRPAGSGGYSSRYYGNTWYADYRAAPISTDLISASPNGNPQGMAAYSSRGPAADGRTKPDIVAPGTDIISVRSRASSDQGWGILSANTNYCFMGGTSMATPLAAGAATVVRQHCVDHLGWDSPSAAVLKAALAGGARSLTPGQYGDGVHREIPAAPRPNNVEGWGQIDVTGTLFPTGNLQSVLLESPSALGTGSSNSFPFYVQASAPLTAAMAYSDYPSALAAAVNLVNDLDLLLIDPAGGLHYPNGRESPDALNNVETIDIANAATGRWTLAVSGRNVPQSPQPFGVFLRGAVLLPVEIAHTPLINTLETNSPYLVSADVTSVGEFDPETVLLSWITSTGTNGFTTQTMATTNGIRFESGIPAQPVGTRIWYMISAGSPLLPTYHPATAPQELHVFDVTPPLALTVTGSPSDLLEASPGYGIHTLASNIAVHAQALYSTLGTNGWRLGCVGWTGSGSVPAAGTQDAVDFTLRADSLLTWLWQHQVTLTQMSSPYGALTATTWHEAGGSASSLTAPESHVYNGDAYTFAGWQLDGSRYPAGTAPSPPQLTGIPMPAPRTAIATYLSTALDSDANGLPDWFELRHFGQLGQNRYADADGDGFENELEAADHTDPLDDESFPAPPVIGHSPLASPASTPAPWPVSATVTDNYRVASVLLQWRRNGGLLRSTAMTNPPGSLTEFTAQIPSPARDGDQIAYSLTAIDAAGFSTPSTTWTVSVSYPRLISSPGSIQTALQDSSQTNAHLFIWNLGSQPLQIALDFVPVGFLDDAEAGTNGWTHADEGAAWHLSPQRSASPSHAWYCGDDDSQSYRNSTHSSLVSPPIQLGGPNARLDFRHWARFEPDTDRSPDGRHYWDSGVIEISTNAGQSWQSLVPEGGYPGLVTSNPASPFAPETPCFVDTLDWDPVGADLSAYAGQIAQFRFRFGADAYVVAEGWRIDDIAATPATQYTGWLTLPPTNASIPVGLGMIFPLALDSTPIPPMATGHLAVRIHHNDPEQPSPLVLPVSLFNTTRRVRVTTDGAGTAAPSGETLVQEAQPFSVALTSSGGHFIAGIRTNSTPAPLPDVVSTQSLAWTSLEGNLDVHAVFAPLLEEGSVALDWLAGYGLTSRNWMAEASLDQDADGLLTWQEEDLGSSPIDPAEAPLVVNLQHPTAPDPAWRVVWHAYTNLDATYSILTSTNPVYGFSTFTNLPATPPVMTSPPLPANHRYFGILSP